MFISLQNWTFQIRFEFLKHVQLTCWLKENTLNVCTVIKKPLLHDKWSIMACGPWHIAQGDLL